MNIYICIYVYIHTHTFNKEEKELSEKILQNFSETTRGDKKGEQDTIFPERYAV